MKARLALIVDDDAAMRQTYRDLLEDEGYDVVTAENGAEGMPVMPGEDMLACLRSRQGSDELAHASLRCTVRARRPARRGVPDDGTLTT